MEMFHCKIQILALVEVFALKGYNGIFLTCFVFLCLLAKTICITNIFVKKE